MNFIDRLAHSCTQFIRANHENSASEKVLFYALSLTINTLLAYSTVIIICSFTGHFLSGLLVVIFYTLLRVISGGVHFSTSLRCCIYTIVLFVCIGHTDLSFSTYYCGTILTVVSLLILAITAPQGLKNQSRIDEKYYPALKIASLIVVSSNFIIGSSTLALVYFAQAMHTTRIIHLLFGKLDSLFDQFTRKEVTKFEN
ncbi:accessory gene regulator ArgB-like protein [Paenibacillus chartarius]|uniref:Accessory gene regulator ArgB-like protein n=1 Tax=Paenibacillus chartarius TaxID=747481 RepID=A0ABV6DRY2_9BACL